MHVEKNTVTVNEETRQTIVAMIDAAESHLYFRNEDSAERLRELAAKIAATLTPPWEP